MNAVIQKSGVALMAALVLMGSGTGVAFAKENGKSDKEHKVAVAKDGSKKDKKSDDKKHVNDGKGSDLQQAIKSGNIDQIKRVAQQMIDTRIQALRDLKSKLDDMKRLSDSDRTSLMNKIQANIDAMTSLRTNIGNDSDLSTIVKHAQSITHGYQIGILANPQIQKMAVADRAEEVVSVFQSLMPKLQDRINEMNGITKDGSDKARAQAALNDMKAKVNDADKLARAAESMVSDLTLADDQASKDANARVFAQARAKLQAAHDDLKAARADLDTIQKILGGKKAR